MSVDAQKLTDIWATLFQVVTAPLSIAACFVLIWMQVGASMLAGLGTIILLFPVNTRIAQTMQAYRALELKCTDRRIKLVTEALSAAKIIKIYGWEPSFTARIQAARQDELDMRKWSAYLEGMSQCVLVVTPVLVSLVTFLVYAATGGTLTATIVFVTMALFNVMRFQLSTFPTILASVFDARVSFARLAAFLVRDELDMPVLRLMRSDEQSAPDNGQGAGDVAVVAIDAGTEFSWDEPFAPALPALAAAAVDAAAVKAADDVQPFVLKVGDALTIRAGEVIAVIGPVGSGKSTLLAALLGEVKRMRGRCAVAARSTAYVAQTAWIFNASLRENILFGRAFDEQRYQQVLLDSALQADLAALPHGDQTPIGDKGACDGILFLNWEHFRNLIFRASSSQASTYRVASGSVALWRGRCTRRPSCSCTTTRCRQSTPASVRTCLNARVWRQCSAAGARS